MKSVVSKPKLNLYGYNCIGRHVGMVIFLCVPLFIGAGTWNWDWAWGYTILTAIGWLVLSAVLVRENPGLLNERGKRTRDLTGTKAWDWQIMGIYAALLILLPLVAGLDYRYQWSAPTSVIFKVLGVVIYTFSFVPLTWSMVVNRFFSGTVRIQPDHSVTAQGPYRYVRHPGYVGVILQFVAVPLTLGTLVAWIPALAGVILYFVRTSLEDRTLQAELPGYAEFARRTKYRLIPGVW